MPVTVQPLLEVGAGAAVPVPPLGTESGSGGGVQPEPNTDKTTPPAGLDVGLALIQVPATIELATPPEQELPVLSTTPEAAIRQPLEIPEIVSPVRVTLLNRAAAGAALVIPVIPDPLATTV